MLKNEHFFIKNISIKNSYNHGDLFAALPNRNANFLFVFLRILGVYLWQKNLC